MGAAKKDPRNFVRLDADESVFFVRQLTYIKGKTYDVEYPELRARQLIPVSMEAGEGAQSIAYHQFDMIGTAKIISNYAKDLPRVDVKGKEFLANVRSLGASYGYSLQDIRSAKMAGVPLEQRKANSAKRAILQQEDAIAFSGDADNGLGGFISNSNISDVAAPNGTSGHPDWARKTNLEMLADMIALSETPLDATLGIEQPDTLLLPLSQYNLAANTQMPNINMTVLKFFLENSPYIKKVEVWNRLKGAGSGATDLMMVYRKDPDKVTLEIPVDFEQLPVQEIGLEFEIPCHSRIGGVLWYYPLSAAKMHGI